MLNNEEVLGRQNTEGSLPLESSRMTDLERLLYREATSLFAQYLPAAFPQEPTELLLTVGLGDTGRYIGKFKGKHYLQTGGDLNSQLFLKITEIELKRDWRERRKRIKEYVDKDIARLIEEYGLPPSYEPEPPIEESEEDLSDARLRSELKAITGSLENRSGYSQDTWNAIEATIHELIHQRQYELNPLISPELSSPELAKVDPNNEDRVELFRLLNEADGSITQTEHAQTNPSIYWPVIEGEASVGAFYVMKKLEGDLIKNGDTEAAEKIHKANAVSMWSIIADNVRDLRKGRLSPTHYRPQAYFGGVNMMRRLYKKLGSDTPTFLTEVDLYACQQIPFDSPKYQEILKNPTLLPKFSKN